VWGTSRKTGRILKKIEENGGYKFLCPRRMAKVRWWGGGGGGAVLITEGRLRGNYKEIQASLALHSQRICSDEFF
jgi:hypothetical protein